MEVTVSGPGWPEGRDSSSVLASRQRWRLPDRSKENRLFLGRRRSFTILSEKRFLFVCLCKDGDEGREGVCARWLRSKRVSSTILSCMADLQGALAHTGNIYMNVQHVCLYWISSAWFSSWKSLSDPLGSSPPDVTSVAHSGLSRLLDHLLDQSDAASSLSPCRADEDTLSGRLRLGLSRLTPPQPNMKVTQQHI